MRAALRCIAPLILLVWLPKPAECFTGLTTTAVRRAGVVRAAPSFAKARPSGGRRVLAMEAKPAKATMLAEELVQEDPYVVEAALVEEDKAV